MLSPGFFSRMNSPGSCSLSSEESCFGPQRILGPLWTRSDSSVTRLSLDRSP